MIFLALGSSIGNAQRIFSTTKDFLKKRGIEVLCQSSIFSNPPEGGVAKNVFSNAVWSIACRDQSPFLLLEKLLECEQFHGRIRRQKLEDRILDLDLLVFFDQQYNSPKLTLPHPKIKERIFVLKPWNEIAPDYFIAHLGKVSELYKEFSKIII